MKAYDTEIGTNIVKAAEILRSAGLVSVPTETVYGLAGNALLPAAVAEIFAVKARPAFDPLILHLADWSEHIHYVQEVSPLAHQLAESFMPGPLTLVLPKRPIISDLVTSGSPFVALRVPQHPLMRTLLAALDFPLAAPSANPFGYISPTNAHHVFAQLGGKIPYILDGGQSGIGLESTIVQVVDDQATVLRKGGLPIEAITELIGPVEVRTHGTSNPSAPGQLKSHYAPRIPLIIGELPALLAANEQRRVGVLSFRESYPQTENRVVEVLAPDGELTTAAQHLFAAMRRLDAQNLEVIFAEWLPEKGLGVAINDRLRRAQAK